MNTKLYSETTIDIVALPKLGEPVLDKQFTITNPLQYEKFNHKLIYTLGCLKALNFNHISFIGKDLDSISEEEAYNLLWHESIPDSDLTFQLLRKLCRKGVIVPWRSWDTNWILTRHTRKTPVKKKGAFYFLGRQGRKWLKRRYAFSVPPVPVEELYLTGFPLSRWLSASSCALTLEQEGWKLVPINQAWQKRTDTPSPLVRPDFIVVKEKIAAFYLFDSPFGLRSEFLAAHVSRGLNFLSSDSIAVILTHTKEAFTKLMNKLENGSISENKNRIFVGGLEFFQKSRGHCKLTNSDGETIVL